AEGKRVCPGDGRLERLGNDVVAHEEVADVSNAVGQLISAPAVLGAGFHAAVLGSNTIDVALLLFYLCAASFEYKGAGDHLLWLQTLDLRHKKFLRFALEIGQCAARLWFQGQAELELEVIDQSDAGWRRGFAGKVIHELESRFERRKEDRTVLLHFGQRKYL